MLPFLYPFHCWRIMHDTHHKNTNKLHTDSAWHPFEGRDWDGAGWFTKSMIRLNRGWPGIFFIGSVFHWLFLHFQPKLFEKEDQPRVKTSIRVVLAFAAVFLPTLMLYAGVWGFVKFWLVPFFIYHFWMSTFTLVHHTMPHVPFLAESKWHDAGARLSGTVHCDYPLGVEFLCHKINVHTPHHVSTRIPSYRLRAAHDALKKQWGKYMNAAVFSWQLLQDILSKCNIYDEDAYYITFQAYDERKRKQHSDSKVAMPGFWGLQVIARLRK